MSQALRWVASSQLGPKAEMYSSASIFGTLDGVNSSFVVSPAPANGMMVVLNGTVLYPGIQPIGQYTYSGATLTFQPQAIPQPDMTLQVFTW